MKKVLLPRLLVILGPTATGKTDLGLKLAKKLNGELVACDSRQVYKGLDIGTGKKPSSKYKVVSIKGGKNYWEVNGIKIWMYDVADPKIQYTVKDYVGHAEKVIEDITGRGKLPIIVGGTGLYLKALLEGLPNLEIPVDEKLRGKLQQLSVRELQVKLQSLSPACWKKMNESDRQNPRRLLRSIELATMNPHVSTIKNLKFKIKNYDLLKIGLTAPRDILKKRIFDRLISRIDQGLIDEGERLYKEELSLERMKGLGLEYGMLAKLLNGEISENQFVNQLSVKIYQYAKRQITWFKKEEDVYWFDITKINYAGEVEKIVARWYYSSNDQAH